MIDINLRVAIPTEPVIYNLDAARIRQVFGNLLSNALRYTPEGGAIQVTLTRQDNSVAIYVQDTGVGIAPEDLPRVFDRFYRADNSRAREVPGTGLGLGLSSEPGFSLCRRCPRTFTTVECDVKTRS